MVFEDNFICLSSREMVDPVLKLALIAGRTHMDGPYPEQDISVFFDPEIRADRLMVRLTQDEIDERTKWNLTKPKDDFVPFKSEQRKKIYSLTIREIKCGDDLLLECE